MISKTHLWQGGVVLIVIFATSLITWRLADINNSDSISCKRDSGRYMYINPLIICDREGASESEISSLVNHNVHTYIDQKKSSGELRTASVYYRDIIDRNWTLIHGEEKFNPASLLKVPTMIAYYSLAEKDPSILSKRLTFRDTVDANDVQYFRASSKLKYGQSYSVDELIRMMIINSDNNAKNLLINSYDQDSLREAYRDLGVSLPQIDKIDYFTAQEFAYFFRVLYNATYLSRTYSEKALELLSKTDFHDGLISTIPRDINVAQKFGERSVVDLSDPDATVRELHDCGVVYYPQHPYILCVMTKGKDFKVLSEIIGGVSKITYDTVKEYYH